MESTRKQLIESICHVLNSGCNITLCENNGNRLKLKLIMHGKKFMAEFYFDEVWNRYIYSLNVDGVSKCLRFLTLDQIAGKQKVLFCPVGAEEVVKFRKSLINRRK